MQHIVGYTANPQKTDDTRYVYGINCLPHLAVKEMAFVKKQFRKEDGRLAYHGYISFKPGEVTPDVAHKIGIQLARVMWGEKYQVVVATHLDCDHIHCHFAINSVSFVDGLKYDRTNAEYARMRELADRLCREQRLSVIENPSKSKIPRSIYLAEKRGEPTRYNVFRQAIDRAVEGSLTQDHFRLALNKMGFEIKMTGKYWTIKTTGDSRVTRLYQLGEQYTNDSIIKRILRYGRYSRLEFHERPKPVHRHYTYKGNFRQAKKLTGFRALYVHYLFLLGKIPKNRPSFRPIHPSLYEDIRKMQTLAAQIRLIHREKLDTSPQLQAYADKTKSRMDDLIFQRTKIQNKLRRAKEPEIVAELKAQKTILTTHITHCRKELKLCDGIAENTRRMKEQMEMIRLLRVEEKLKQQLKTKNKERGYVR
jgi:hypothetical protein